MANPFIPPDQPRPIQRISSVRVPASERGQNLSPAQGALPLVQQEAARLPRDRSWGRRAPASEGGQNLKPLTTPVVNGLVRRPQFGRGGRRGPSGY